jgi:c-di-GMP-binding flagellar brake protein YcgR
MAEQYTEILTEDQSITNTLQSMIDHRAVGKMEIPDTRQSGITMILEMKKMKGFYFLSIDRIEGLEPALSNNPTREVTLEFMDKGGVPCRFRARIAEYRPNDILLELPTAIYRIQKRQYFRIDVLPGVEVTFRTGTSGEKRGEVKNLSEGGMAFFIEKDLNLGIGTLLIDISSNIPDGTECLRLRIPQAVVRRMVLPSFLNGRTLCAIEFLEISHKTKDQLIAYISKQQMGVIQKLKG